MIPVSGQMAVIKGKDFSMAIKHLANIRNIRKFNIFIMLSLAIALADGLFVYINYLFSKDAFMAEFEQQRDTYEKVLQSQLDNTYGSLLLVASLFANDEEVQSLFLQGKQAVEAEGGGPGGSQSAKIRNLLNQKVSPEWNKAIQNLNTRQLHFHLGPGSLSFLRVHKPQKFGDRMDDIRFIIVDTNADRKQHTGFETGRVYSGLRAVMPVYANDLLTQQSTFVGALEAGASFKNILNTLDSRLGLGSAVLLSFPHVNAVMWPDFIKKKFGEGIKGCNCVLEDFSRPEAQQLMEKLASNIDLFSTSSAMYILDEKDSSTAFFMVPLRDYLGGKDASRENVGVVVFWHDISDTKAAFIHEQRFNIIYALLAYLFIEFLLFIAFRQTTRFLENQIDIATDRLQQAQLIAHVGNWDIDLTSNQSFCSDELLRIFETTRLNFHPSIDTFLKYVHPDDREQARSRLGKVLGNEASSGYTVLRLLFDNLRIKYVSIHSQAVPSKNNKLFRQVGTVQDVTELMQAENRLKLLASVFTHAREGVLITSSDATIIDVNKSFTRITGYSRDEVINQKPSLLKSGVHDKAFFKDFWQQLNTKGFWSGEIFNRRKNGEVYPEMLTIGAVYDDHNRVQHFVALFTDISKQKEKHLQQLEKIEHYDRLTKLPNRSLLMDRLNQSMAQVNRRNLMLAVIYIDIDDFKQLNENYGKDVGDEVLTSLSSRLYGTLREGDTLARVGGDEFVMILLDIDNCKACVPMLNRLQDELSKEIVLEHASMTLSCSMGISFYPQDMQLSPDQLLRQTDQAMYEAKVEGKNRYHVFDPVQDKNVRGRHESLERIREALLQEEFTLYYQPKVNMRLGKVIGVEALIRWMHPQQGLLPPIQFLPIIEHHPLMLNLDEWVINKALAQMLMWKESGLDIKISVNIGALLQQADAAHRIRKILQAHDGVNPENLTIEILETSALEDIKHVTQVINDCASMGVQFSVDDFGTGYSSLTYLKRLPASELKIDQSFVRGMLDDPADIAILDSIINMARVFRRTPIAEGVESFQHAELLLQLGCNNAQGYAIAKPMPSSELHDWVKYWKPVPQWSKVNVVRHDELPILFAKIEFMAWLKQIEDCIRNKVNIEETLGHFETRFGEWIYGNSNVVFSARPSFAATLKSHKDLHDFVEGSCSIEMVLNEDVANDIIDKLHIHRDNLLNLLDKLRHESNQPNQ